MLKIDQLVSRQGVKLCGFFIRNGRDKVLAIGAQPSGSHPGFVSMHAKRYAKDRTLVAAVHRLTGIEPRPWRDRRGTR